MFHTFVWSQLWSWNAQVSWINSIGRRMILLTRDQWWEALMLFVMFVKWAAEQIVEFLARWNRMTVISCVICYPKILLTGRPANQTHSCKLWLIIGIAWLNLSHYWPCVGWDHRLSMESRDSGQFSVNLWRYVNAFLAVGIAIILD